MYLFINESICLFYGKFEIKTKGNMQNMEKLFFIIRVKKKKMNEPNSMRENEVGYC